MDIINIASTIISIIALGFSIYAIVKTSKHHNVIQNILEAQEKDRIIDRSKADLISELYQRGSGNYDLYIRNIGQSKAEKISIMINGDVIENYPNNLAMDNSPEIIGKNSHCDFCLAFCQDDDDEFKIEIVWEDESGIPGKYENIHRL